MEVWLQRTLDNALGDFQVGDTWVNARDGSAIGPGGSGQLQPKVMEVLVALARAQGRVVSRERLLDTVWPGAVVSDDVLSRCVYQLRKLLGSTAGHGVPIIETVPKRGYRMIAPVKLPVDEGERQPPLRPHTVAVLPFLSVSTDPDNEYFSDGLSEELIHTLTGIGSLRVVGRTSSFAFKDRSLDLRQIARKLNADALVEGSVRRSGNRVRVTAQLVDGRTGVHRWSGTFEREIQDLFLVQEAIARVIAEALEIRLTGGELERSSLRASQNPEAFDALLRARARWADRSVEGVRVAIDHFEQCVALDPGFALAYCGLADAYAVLPWVDGVDACACYERARAAATRALALAPELAEAHAALGMIRCEFDFDWAGAQTSLREAIRLKPGYAEAHHRYHCLLDLLGRHAEALAEIKLAAYLDPLAALYACESGLMLALLGRPSEAVEQFRDATELAPEFALAHGVLATHLVRIGAAEEAAPALDDWARLEGLESCTLSRLVQTAADPARTHAASRALGDIPLSSGARAFVVIGLYLALGDAEHAARAFVLSHERRLPGALFTFTLPGAHVLREHQDVAPIVESLRLPPS